MTPHHNTIPPPKPKQVEGPVPPALAAAALAQWEAAHKGQLPPPALPSSASTHTHTTTATALDGGPTGGSSSKEVPYADLPRVRALVDSSEALLVVRVILASGATVRDGVEIDVAEQVRNLPQVILCIFCEVVCRCAC